MDVPVSVRRYRRVASILVLACVVSTPAYAQASLDASALLQEADRVAWLKAWSTAAPLFTEVRRQALARGDQRTALYADINLLRSALPRLAIRDASQRLATYLDHPLVQADDRLRLRCLVIKGEVDLDLDPALAQTSWQEAVVIADRLGETGWANRSRGELGVVAFLLGNINTSIVELGRALTTAQATGDLPSVVRWLTLFGTGYVQLGRPEQALHYYDQALKAASAMRELRMPVMTYVGKSGALLALQRFAEADALLQTAVVVAEQEGALGYQAELALQQAEIDAARGQTASALRTLARATDLARRADGQRLLAQIDLVAATLQRRVQRVEDAERSLQNGLHAARRIADQFLLPRLLAELADLRIAQRRYADARSLLDEAHDLLEGLLTHAASPWVRSRLIGGMDTVYAARLRLEAADRSVPRRTYAIVEQGRARSLLDLLFAAPRVSTGPASELRARSRELSALQLQLLQTTSRSRRQRLLDRIFTAESRLATVSTELFARTQTPLRQPRSLAALQATLAPDEVVLEFALADPVSFCLVITRDSARRQVLGTRTQIDRMADALLTAIREGSRAGDEARQLHALILEDIPELATHARVIVSPDGGLHHVPFELLAGAAEQPLLRTHIVTYVPSGSLLTVLRERTQTPPPSRMTLAVSASEDVHGGTLARTRGLDIFDTKRLAPLAAANDEARLAATLQIDASTVLLGAEATELAVKRAPLWEYDVLHFAVHGLVSSTVPSRSALLLRPSGDDDGLLQAGEILGLRLRASLVTLSACDSGTGTVHGQDGVASLVRPFLAAGAHSVVANLWTADDQISLTLMRTFYTRLAGGMSVAEALRDAKVALLDRFGSQAVPRLWSGLLVYGDGARRLRTLRVTSREVRP